MRNLKEGSDMLILIILGAVALLSILLLILGRTVWDFYEEPLCLIGAVLGCCIIAIAISGGVAIGIQAHTEEDYINALNEKATIEYFISQSDDDILRDKSLYNRIMDFNHRITYSKYRADSPWVGIWVNKKIGTIDYIELTTGEK